MPRNRNTVPAVCVQCSRPFFSRADSLAAGFGRLCSRKCRDARKRKPSVSVRCKRCGEIFQKLASRVASGRGTTCSRCAHRPPRFLSLTEAIWARVDRSAAGCWEWQGNRDDDGYGRFHFQRRSYRAHRAAWESVHGPIPPGMLIRHVVCDNPPCVRPDHLALGVQADNVADRYSKGRTASGSANGSYTRPERRRRGDQHGQAKLTESQVVEIRRMVADGESTMTEIAHAHGVSLTAISAIVRRRTWAHI